jgi:tetratricopeptide (TPR) repeat protein
VLDLLTALVEKSLVQYEEPGGHAGGACREARYRLLETVRHYSRERLLETGEAEAVRGRHRDWYLAYAERAKPELVGSDQVEWLDRLEAEHDNLRAVIAGVTRRGEVEAGLRLGAALKAFWMARGYVAEGRERLAALLAMPGAEARTALRALALREAAHLSYNLGDLPAVQALHEESLAIGQELDDKGLIAASLCCMGLVASEQGNYSAGRALSEQSLTLGRELGDKDLMALSLHSLAHVAHFEGDFGTARALYEESVTLRRELGDKRSVSTLLNYLGDLAARQEEYPAAGALYAESLAIKRELGDVRGIAATLSRLGSVAMLQRDYVTAQALCEESLAIAQEQGSNKHTIANSLNNLARVAREQGDYGAACALLSQSLGRAQGDSSLWWAIYECLDELASVALGQGQAERAVRLYGALAALFAQTAPPRPAADQARYGADVASLRATLGEEGFAAAWAQGQRMPQETAVAYALEGCTTPPAEAGAVSR